MPFKFVFPYWTILSIIVVGGLCVFVDLWWGVKPVWKGLSWRKLRGRKSYLRKQGVDGFFWMGVIGRDSGQALLAECVGVKAGGCGVLLEDEGLSNSEVLPEDEGLSNKVLIWEPLEGPVREHPPWYLPSDDGQTVTGLDPIWNQAVVKAGVLSLRTSDEGRPVTDPDLVAGIITPGPDLEAGILVSDYLSIEVADVGQYVTSVHYSIVDKPVCVYLYGAHAWGRYPKLAFRLSPEHDMAEDFPVGAHLLTVWFRQHRPLGLYVKDPKDLGPFFRGKGSNDSSWNLGDPPKGVFS